MKIKKILIFFSMIITLVSIVGCNNSNISSSSSSSSSISNSSSIEIKEAILINEIDYYCYGPKYVDVYNGLYGVCKFCSLNLVDSEYNDKLRSYYHIVGDKIHITSNDSYFGNASNPETITFPGDIFSFEYQKAKVVKIDESQIDRDNYGNIVHIAGYEQLEYVILNESLEGYSKCSIPKYVTLSSYSGDVYASYYKDKPVALYSFNPLEYN